MFPLNTKILVIDDMPTMRKVVMKSLRTIGFTDIHEANNGKEAWKILEAYKGKVGLVISDWNMPEMTGIELLKNVRMDKRFENLPFVLLTVESEPEHILEATVNGVTDYIIKPFDEKQLAMKLRVVHTKVTEKTM